MNHSTNPHPLPVSASKPLRMLARVLLSAVLIVFAALAFNPLQAFVPSFSSQNRYAIILVHDLPPEARDTLNRIKAGGPFPYRKDGIVFGNREGRLPRKQHGYYFEYTVATPGAHDRGARRVIAGAGREHDPRFSGEYYYTDDHYATFKRIVER